MKLRLIKKLYETKEIRSFLFEPENKISYLAGQYFYITLPNLKYPDPRGNTRYFTISSSPTEGNNLQITTKIRKSSGFKKTLDELSINDVIEGEGPNGVFYFDENTTGDHLFLAGGIGITLFRTMLKYMYYTKLNTNITLLYSNLDDDFVFKKELEKLNKEMTNFKLVKIIGKIEKEHIVMEIKNLNKPTFWICGTPQMSDNVEKILHKLKINPERIKADKFTGY